LSDSVKILLTSTAAGAILFWLAPVSYQTDSASYLAFAKQLAGFQPIDGSIRTAGFPLLMVVTGVIRFDTFLGLMMTQLVMAILIPLVMYEIIKTYKKDAAYYSALLSIFTLVPYAYMKTVLTDHFFIFMLVVSIYAASKFFSSNANRFIYLSFLAAFLLLLIRPAAQYIFIIFFLVILIRCYKTHRKGLVHAGCACFCVILLLNFYVFLLNRFVFNSKTILESSNYSATRGKMLFANVYLSQGFGRHYTASIRRNDGPASREFLTLLHDLLTREDAMVSESLSKRSNMNNYHYFYGRFRDNPDGLYTQIIRSPARSYFWFLWGIMDRKLGPVRSDALFLEVALEILKNRPEIFIKFAARNMYYFISGKSASYTYATEPTKRFVASDPIFYGMVYPSSQASMQSAMLTNNLSSELKYQHTAKRFITLYRFFLLTIVPKVVLLLRPALFFLMITSCLLLFKTECFPIVSLATLIAFYQLLIVSVFSEPLFRYTTHTFLVELLAAAPAAASILNRLICRVRTSYADREI
jgi:hypothetical protein